MDFFCELNSGYLKDIIKFEFLEYVFVWIIKLRIIGWDYFGFGVVFKFFFDKKRVDLRIEIEGKRKWIKR